MFRFGCVCVKSRYYYDNGVTCEEITPLLAMAISHGLRGEDFEDFRAKLSCVYYDWEFYSEEFGRNVFADFLGFLHFLHVKKISYVFAFDSVNFACSLDYAILEQSRAGRVFKRVKMEEQKDKETGKYKRVDGDSFSELSGDGGQRYMFQIWTRDKGRRSDGEGVTRRLTTHGVDFYFFNNIISVSFDDLCVSFSASRTEGDARALYLSVMAFSDVCNELMGEKFIDPERKRPLAMTCGGLAKNEILKYISSGKTNGKRKANYKKKHPLTQEQADYLRRCRLLRGGLNYLSPTWEGKAWQGLRKYDANSEYSYVSTLGVDLVGELERVAVEEFFNPLAEFEYILILRELHMTVRNGFPPIFTDPWTGEERARVDLENEFALFRTEYVCLLDFYEIEYIVPSFCLRVRREGGDGFKKFGEKYFSVKMDGRRECNRPFELFGKLMLNSGIGKLSEKGKFPITTHEYNKNTMLIEQKTTYPDDIGAGGAGLGLVVGSYIVALGRCYLMERIKQIAEYNGVRPVDVLIYTDTDSIVSPFDAPPTIVSSFEMGKMKLECVSDFSKYIAKKVYINIEVAKKKIDIHCRGIQREAIEEYILEQTEAEDIFNVPVWAWEIAFNSQNEYYIKVNYKVSGGRCVLCCPRAITETPETNKRSGGTLSRLGEKNIIEI